MTNTTPTTRRVVKTHNKARQVSIAILAGGFHVRNKIVCCQFHGVAGTTVGFENWLVALLVNRDIREILLSMVILPTYCNTQ